MSGHTSEPGCGSNLYEYTTGTLTYTGGSSARQETARAAVFWAARANGSDLPAELYWLHLLNLPSALRATSAPKLLVCLLLMQLSMRNSHKYANTLSPLVSSDAYEAPRQQEQR